MRSHAKRALLSVLLCLIAASDALGQDKPASSNGAYRVTSKDSGQQKAIPPRLLTLGDGLAILGAALDVHHHADVPSDCSHLVHELYGRAGFPYEYASSSDLYTGIDEFRRVVTPQPGDLAVWRGHAGIVINPAQHSFFSTLSSGPGVDSYDSPYWKQRGRPRFFRYVKGVPSGVLPTSARTASGKPAVLNNTEPHETAAGDPVPNKTVASSNQVAAASDKLAANQPMNKETPDVVVVHSVRPNPDQVTVAFLEACEDAEESLRGRDLFRSAQSLVVFDHFEVRKLHITGKQDWVEVQINELVSLTEGKAVVHKRSERQRWPLNRRDSNSWDLTPPRNTIYLPEHIAERILAQELAQLTGDSPDRAARASEKAQLARLLNVLLDK